MRIFMCMLLSLLTVVVMTPLAAQCEEHPLADCNATGSVCQDLQACMGESTTSCASPCDSAHASFDLTSQVPSTTVSNMVLPQGTSATIDLQGVQKVVQSGDAVTAAEHLALLQVLSGGTQQLLLDAAGRAIGGSFSLDSLPTHNVCSLVIPEGVVAYRTASSSPFNVAGNLIAYGSLFGLPGDAAGVDIRAGLIHVADTGTISTRARAIPDSQGLNPLPVDLTLVSASDIVNSGIIASSGNLTLNASGTIINELPHVASPGSLPPVIAGDLGVSMVAGKGTVINHGVIASALADVNIAQAAGRDLLINNTSGTVYAADLARFGSFGDPGKIIVDLTGGIVEARSIEFFGGDGAIKIFASELKGPLDVTAGQAYIATERGDLTIANMALSGDPTIVNMGGNVTLAGNADSGATLRFAGQDLAILASGSINAAPGLTLIDTSADNGRGGTTTLAAGVVFTPDSGGIQIEEPPAPLTLYTFQGFSAGGGNINLGNVNIKTSSDSGDAGRVFLVAHDGTPFTPATDRTGLISIGGIDASSATGRGGDVLIIGQSGPITINGAINSNGQTAGAVGIAGGEPQATGPITFYGGTIGGTGQLIASQDPSHDPVDIDINDAITAGVIVIGTSGNIRIAPVTAFLTAASRAEPIFASDTLTIRSTRGDISLFSLDFRPVLPLYRLDLFSNGTQNIIADAGNISIGPQVRIASLTGNLSIQSAAGSIIDAGSNIYVAQAGRVEMFAGTSLALGAGSEFVADTHLFALSGGTLTVGDNTRLQAREGLLGLASRAALSIGTGNLFMAGLLTGALDPLGAGLLGVADVARPGFLYVASDNDIAIGSGNTFISSGLDLAVSSFQGSVSVGENTRWQSNGGFVSIFAANRVSGSRNVFVSRAVGDSAAFRGGFIDIASGFSFNPFIQFLSAGGPVESLQSDPAARVQIFQAAAQANSVINSVAQSSFAAVGLPAGTNVSLNSNGIDQGLLNITRLGSSQVDLSNSSLSFRRGSIFIESIAVAANNNQGQVVLTDSQFSVESYGVVPTGLFSQFLSSTASVLGLTPAQLTAAGFLPSTVTPFDQNQFIKDFVVPYFVDNQGAGSGPAQIKGLLQETPQAGRIAGALKEYLVPILDTADAESGGKALSTFKTVAQLSQSPMLRVSRDRTEMFLFTTANQILTGNFLGSSEVVVVGSAGTAAGISGNVVVLHTGKLTADTGGKELTLSTRLGTVRVAPESTAEIRVEPGKMLRVMALGGKGRAVTVDSQLVGGAVDLATGEELVLAEADLTAEDLIPADGIKRQVISGGIDVIRNRPPVNKTVIKNVFSMDQYVASDSNMISKATRLSGARKASYERMARHIAVASSSTRLLARPGASQRQHPDLSGRMEPGEPLHLLAAAGTLFSQDKPGTVTVRSGALFMRAPQATVIEAESGSVSLARAALAAIDVEEGLLRVKALSGIGSVAVTTSNHRMPMDAGKEVLVIDHEPSKNEALPQDGVGRRQLAVHRLEGSAHAVVGDFSIVSFLSSASHMQAIKSRTSPTHKAIHNQLLKTAAVREFMTGHHGRYYVRPMETALAPQWPFQQPIR